jgi:hypothetical protein
VWGLQKHLEFSPGGNIPVTKIQGLMTPGVESIPSLTGAKFFPVDVALGKNEKII